MKLRKGDRVKVLLGKDRGDEGEIMRVLPKENKVIVEGVNVAKKHCGPTRIGYRFDDSAPGMAAKKVRICRKCGGDV
jgi:large subunit ribosomal protein L24